MEVVKMGVRTKKYGSHPFAKKIKKEKKQNDKEKGLQSKKR
jgi:hypothetical protein